MGRKLKALLTLMRVELAGFSFVAVIGALTVKGRDLAWREMVILFAANILLVVLGFVHNDIMDLEIDKRTAALGERPLVNGELSVATAWWVSAVCFVANPLLVWWGLGSPEAAVLILVADILAMLYNVYSKSFSGADVLYAASAAVLCLSGAVAVAAKGTPWRVQPALTWTIVAIMFVEHFFFNVVSGGMKDVEFDRAAGVTTLAVRLSRHDPGKAPVMSVTYRLLAISVKLVSLGLAMLPLLTASVPHRRWQLPVMVLMSLGALGLTAMLVGTPLTDRETILNRTRMQETLCKALVPVMLLDLVGIPWALALMVAPVFWFGFFNYALNRELLSNPRTF